MNSSFYIKDGQHRPQHLLENVNTLTANYEYSRSNTENLPLPIEAELTWKLKTFAFLQSTLNLEHFQKKNEPHSSSISEVIDSERRGYLNA